jgi:hypothetical protein
MLSRGCVSAEDKAAVRQTPRRVEGRRRVTPATATPWHKEPYRPYCCDLAAVPT